MCAYVLTEASGDGLLHNHNAMCGQEERRGLSDQVGVVVVLYWGYPVGERGCIPDERVISVGNRSQANLKFYQSKIRQKDQSTAKSNMSPITYH